MLQSRLYRPPCPLPFSAAHHLHTRQEHIAYLNAALATGDPLYISRALRSLAEALGVDEGEDELAELLRVAAVLGARVTLIAPGS